MAAGLTLYSDISARVNDLIEDSLAVARMTNMLLPTITSLTASGMELRKVNEYNALTFATAGEEDDTGAQQFSKDPLTTLTPAIYRARVDITDPRARSDFDREMANASLELGAAAAMHIDSRIATQFASLTGGTIGSAGTTITWRHITKSYALLVAQGIPRGLGVYCALHPYVWEVLLSLTTIAGATVSVAPAFQDRVTDSPNFFQIPRFQGITFVITDAITVDSDGDTKGALYVPQAIAVDTRKAFDIRPQRDESKELTELNASMWYAAGVWRPKFGITILSDAATPS